MQHDRSRQDQQSGVRTPEPPATLDRPATASHRQPAAPGDPRAQALRANLLRRKQQTRARETGAPDTASPAAPRPGRD